MNRIIKNYEKFINEDKQKSLNEGRLSDFIKKSVNNLIQKFLKKFGKSGGFLAGLYMTKNGLFKKWGIEGINFYDFSNMKPQELKEHKNSFDYLLLLEKESSGDIVNLKHPSPSVVNVRPDELFREIIETYETKQSLLIWGAPGVGKSQIVLKAAQKLRIRCIDIRLSYREPTDFIGMPVTVDETKTTIFYLPSIFPRYDSEEEDPGGILFLDEINRAPQPVLNASLQLILDKKLDTYELPKKWVCIAAANRPETGEAPEATPLGSALLNRFVQVNLYMEAEDWANWAYDAKASEKQANSVIKAGESYIPDEIIGFLLFRSEYLHKYDVEADVVAWPSPRTWDMAAYKLTTAKRLAEKEGRRLSDNEIKSIMARVIGIEAATQFINFIQLIRQVPDIEKLHLAYTEPDKAPLPPKNKPEIAHAMAISIALSKKGEKINVDNLYNIMKYAERMNNKELATPLIHYVVRNHPYVKEDPRYMGEFLIKWNEKFNKRAEF